MSDRRSFLKKGGLFGTLLGAGLVGHAMATVPEVKEKKEDITVFAPSSDDNLSLLRLESYYKEREPLMDTDLSGTVIIAPNNNNATNTNSVTMTVGRDNRLWIKVNDEWKRVAIES